MALVGNNYVKGMNRNVEFLGIFVYGFVPYVEDRIASEQVYCHPLDRADVNESITLFRIDQIRLRQGLRIKLLGFVEILPLKRFNVQLVKLFELKGQFRVERRQ